MKLSTISLTREKTQILCNNADAHRKQRESLPPEKKNNILQTNDDAHKIKQESLSPEDQDLFDKNNAAVLKKHRKSLTPDQTAQELEKNAVNHEKHRKSLLPEQKAQIKSINAIVHKIQYELLPPKKKARLMETKTEQRHKHLTEEEKTISAQIRSVAATIYEKVDLDKPTVEFLRKHFYKDPTLALAYFYCCSTDPCVAVFKRVFKRNRKLLSRSSSSPHKASVFISPPLILSVSKG
jgi:hypothetical protein